MPLTILFYSQEIGDLLFSKLCRHNTRNPTVVLSFHTIFRDFLWHLKYLFHGIKISLIDFSLHKYFTGIPWVYVSMKC